MDLDELGRKLRALEARLDRAEASARLSHASIDNTSVQVRDGSGGLRGLIGVQADGTTAVNVVNGPPPPQPSAPAVASVLGGVSAGWDGTFTGGAVLPLDWARTEVHASTTAAFTPTALTLSDTIETAQGATIIVPTGDPVYVRLVARSTSGTASAPSDVVGPFGPAPVVANDILDGIVTEVKLAANAVTDAKIAAGAVKTVALADGAVLDTKLADNAVKVGKIAAGAVTMNTLGGALGDTASQRFTDYFRDATAWAQLYATSGGSFTINTTPAGTPSGGGRLIATGEVQVAAKALIPQDSDTLYRVMIRVRATAQDPSGPATVYLGAVGVAEDGVTLVNRNGANLNTTQFYCCSAGGSLGTADGWRTYVGWLQGHAASGVSPDGGPFTDPRSPGQTHASVRYLRPMVWLNFGKSTAAVMEAEAVTVEAVRTGVVGSTNLISGSVTAGAIAADAVIAGKIAADAITARELAVNSVTAAELSAGSVTAAAVAAGAITTDKLTVTGGANLLSDPSFEGAYTAALVAGNSSWSVDASKGNGSNKSLKVDATAGTPTNRDLALFDMPILAGEQLVLAVDYQASTDYVGTPRIYARWENASGTFLASGAAQASPPTVGATWQRITATVTAPANTARVKLNVASTGGTAGSLWFDNAAVRPVVGGTQIQDGAVTTQKVVAGAIQTLQLAAEAVNADKIASGAITTAKLDALAVTTDKIAANAITADKILAGSITATALSATAIDGKTITGAVIQTATSGERITLNEDDENMVLIYNAAGVAVGELSARGLGLLGSTGAAILVDPNATYPQLRWLNSAGTNWASAQIGEPTAGDANLELVSGKFTGSSYTDMRWRVYLANDALLMDRLRSSNPNTRIGGRFWGGATYATVGYANTDTPTLESALTVESTVATIGQARLQVSAPASALSVLYGEAPTGHTGNLARLNRGGSDKFTVDKDGNTNVAGKLTAGNMAFGSVSITPSAAGVPTSAIVNFAALPGTVFRGFVTAQTTVPGDRTPTGNAGVTGVSISDVTATSALVWVNRQNTTSTTINWQVVSA